jgi:hypothetical protein
VSSLTPPQLVHCNREQPLIGPVGLLHRKKTSRRRDALRSHLQLIRRTLWAQLLVLRAITGPLASTREYYGIKWHDGYLLSSNILRDFIPFHCYQGTFLKLLFRNRFKASAALYSILFQYFIQKPASIMVNRKICCNTEH